MLLKFVCVLDRSETFQINVHMKNNNCRGYSAEDMNLYLKQP